VRTHYEWQLSAEGQEIPPTVCKRFLVMTCSSLSGQEGLHFFPSSIFKSLFIYIHTHTHTHTLHCKDWWMELYWLHLYRTVCKHASISPPLSLCFSGYDHSTSGGPPGREEETGNKAIYQWGDSHTGSSLLPSV